MNVIWDVVYRIRIIIILWKIDIVNYFLFGMKMLGSTDITYLTYYKFINL